ncbi:MAG TPA: hypothetical protein VGJ03_11340, partial [Acidimicrobiales bacterium]
MALGEPVVAIEDDGGVPDPNGGHRSVTRVATQSGTVQVSPLGEFNEALHTDPFGWIVEINFPERSRQQCPSPDEIAKGEEFIDEMLKAIGDLKKRVTRLEPRSRPAPASSGGAIRHRQSDKTPKRAQRAQLSAPDVRSDSGDVPAVSAAPAARR